MENEVNVPVINVVEESEERLEGKVAIDDSKENREDLTREKGAADLPKVKDARIAEVEGEGSKSIDEEGPGRT